MPNISIGTLTPKINPKSITVLIKDKPVAVQETYTGVGYFSWPATFVGKKITIKWDTLHADDFDSLTTIFVDDSSVVFHPQDGGNLTFNVKVTNLDGEYLHFMNKANTTYRLSVVVDLLVLSTNTIP